MPDTFLDSVKLGFTTLSPLTYIALWRKLGDPNSQFNAFGKSFSVKDLQEKHVPIGLVRGLVAYSGSMMTGLLAYKAYLIKKAYDAAKTTKNTANLLQERLIGAATFVHSVKKIDALAHNHSAVRDGLQHAHTMKLILNGSLEENGEFKELIGMLQTNTFKGEASFFSFTGRVLAAYKHMQAHKAHFAAIMELVGELDAYLSLAKLVKKFKHERVAYCFVEYATGDTSYLNLQQFWNRRLTLQL